MDYAITKITIKYHCISKFKLNEILIKDKEYLTWEHSEYVIIDGNRDTIEIYKEIGTECNVTSIYHIDEDEISDFFDLYDGQTLFVKLNEDSTQTEPDPLNVRQYEITVEFEDASLRKISGIFDGNNLPDDYAKFMDNLAELISNNSYSGDLFNKSIYKTRKKKRGEYIFCSVEFENAYKSYYYLTDDESLEIDDFVVVPVGKNNRETVAHIVDIEYFNLAEVPMPLKNVKSIIRRADEEKDNFLKDWFD